MFNAHFTSTSKKPLSHVVLGFLDRAKELSNQGPVEVDLMVFSFTDTLIYERIIALSSIKNVRFRLLADWGNISSDNERKTALLADLRSSKIEIKYKYDQPYIWDLQRDRLQWSYHASLGMLHHKTIMISLNGLPKHLLTGSFNWTKQGVENYENILVVTGEDIDGKAILNAFNLEFSTLWDNNNLSLNPAQARMHLARIKQFYMLNKQHTAVQLNKALTNGEALQDDRFKPTQVNTNTAKSQLAFSGSHPFKSWRKMGYAATNSWRYFNMTKESGVQKRVPLSLTTVALDVIFSADSQSQLCLCMYAISQRVPEYGALLKAARNGVSIRMILDKEANKHFIDVLMPVVLSEHLPIKVRTSARGMHQKYLLDATKGNLVTGTANMSTDASDRHSEHRFLFKNNKELTEQFKADFETIWTRLPPKP